MGVLACYPILKLFACYCVHYSVFLAPAQVAHSEDHLQEEEVLHRAETRPGEHAPTAGQPLRQHWGDSGGCSPGLAKQSFVQLSLLFEDYCSPYDCEPTLRMYTG